MPVALGQQERFWNFMEPLASLATPDPACTRTLQSSVWNLEVHRP